MRSVVDVLSMFFPYAGCVLVDPDDEEVYSGTVRQAIKYLMMNPRYNSIPKDAEWWLTCVENNILMVYVDDLDIDIFDDLFDEVFE